MKSGFATLSVVLSLATGSIAMAAAQPFITFGYGRGGSELSPITGGQGYNTEAGSGLLALGGIMLPISPTVPHRFELQLGAGYMFQDDARDKTNTVSWSRIPLEALYLYHNTRNHFRLGWGAIYHLAGRIDGKGSYTTATTSVENAFGWLLSADWFLSFKNFDAHPDAVPGTVDHADSALALGIRYQMIQYRTTRFGTEANGDAFLITMTYY